MWSFAEFPEYYKQIESKILNDRNRPAKSLGKWCINGNYLTWYTDNLWGRRQKTFFIFQRGNSFLMFHFFCQSCVISGSNSNFFIGLFLFYSKELQISANSSRIKAPEQAPM